MLSGTCYRPVSLFIAALTKNIFLRAVFWKIAAHRRNEPALGSIFSWIFLLHVVVVVFFLFVCFFGVQLKSCRTWNKFEQLQSEENIFLLVFSKLRNALNLFTSLSVSHTQTHSHALVLALLKSHLLLLVRWNHHHKTLASHSKSHGWAGWATRVGGWGTFDIYRISIVALSGSGSSCHKSKCGA